MQHLKRVIHIDFDFINIKILDLNFSVLSELKYHFQYREQSNNHRTRIKTNGRYRSIEKNGLSGQKRYS